ncbi:fimbrial protein [Serratia nevei]|uniref:fimbrial protein n=1 Tax=Serratia nevei TaxID=2703794 RepID=UPI00313ED6A3
MAKGARVKMRTRVRQAVAALLLCGCGGMAFTQAATVKVSVTVVKPLPCIINGGRPIEVNFGDEVMTTRIDGQRYRMPIDFSFTCNNPYKNAMRMQIRGGTVNFGQGLLLGTSRDGLGIAILRQENGTRLPMNSWLNFTYPNPVKLDAVPVKRAGVELATGEFTAAATLQVDFQ